LRSKRTSGGRPQGLGRRQGHRESTGHGGEKKPQRRRHKGGGKKQGGLAKGKIRGNLYVMGGGKNGEPPKKKLKGRESGGAKTVSEILKEENLGEEGRIQAKTWGKMEGSNRKSPKRPPGKKSGGGRPGTHNLSKKKKVCPEEKGNQVAGSVGKHDQRNSQGGDKYRSRGRTHRLNWGIAGYTSS